MNDELWVAGKMIVMGMGEEVKWGTAVSHDRVRQQRILERNEFGAIFIRLFRPFVVVTSIEYLVDPYTMTE